VVVVVVVASAARVAQAAVAVAADAEKSLPPERGLSRGFHRPRGLRRLKSEALSTCGATNSLQL
jgi:hypothetical protein